MKKLLISFSICAAILQTCRIGISQNINSHVSPLAFARPDEPFGRGEGSGVRSIDEKLRGNGIAFTENKGQVADMEGNPRPDVLYSADADGASIYLRKGGISYVMSKMEEDAPTLKGGNAKSPLRDLGQHGGMRSIQRVDMDFLGSNKEAKAIEEEQTVGYKNYYLGHLSVEPAGCPQGIIGVKTYKKINYENIYQNIDISFLGGNGNEMKYDFIVKPGGNPDDIQLKS